MHWWYWPDSYDSWIPVDQAPDVDDPDKPARGQLPPQLMQHKSVLARPDLLIVVYS